MIRYAASALGALIIGMTVGFATFAPTPAQALPPTQCCLDCNGFTVCGQMVTCGQTCCAVYPFHC